MLKQINRRQFIKTAGALIPLPFLPSISSGAIHKPRTPIKRVCFINLGHGLMPKNFAATGTGPSTNTSSLYLKQLEPIKDRFTVFSGLSHDGISNHVESQGFLTGFPKGNSVSVDQLISPELSKDCRYDSLVIAPFVKASGSSHAMSYNRAGVMISPIKTPQALFTKLFTESSKAEKATLLKNIETNKSILDHIQDDYTKLKTSADHTDQQLLEEYFQAIREAEQKLTRNKHWLQSPKPEASIKFKPFSDGIFDLETLERYLRLEADLMYLALLSESTRVISLNYAVNDLPLNIAGNSTNAHRTYSHHNQDPEKIKTLTRIESTQFKTLAAEFLIKLNSKKADGSTFLDDTLVMAGSNLGNPPNHSGKNLPIIVAGAGFEKQHGQNIAYDKDNNEPLSDLFLTFLNKIGIDKNQFALSTDTLKGISI